MFKNELEIEIREKLSEIMLINLFILFIKLLIAKIMRKLYQLHRHIHQDFDQVLEQRDKTRNTVFETLSNSNLNHEFDVKKTVANSSEF